MYFDDDNVTTSVDIRIPDEMWLRAKSFEVGDSVKVRGFWGIGMVVVVCKLWPV